MPTEEQIKAKANEIAFYLTDSEVRDIGWPDLEEIASLHYETEPSELAADLLQVI